ncbi:MAG: hypothetical protein M3232_00170 [Thermoproteota archaeon]|nr:hypothetical protein [Thermoproteota archaeon]
MPVIADSYMGIFLPPDVSVRIKQFMAAKVGFPFLGKDELLAVFYLFGKDYKVIGESEVNAASDLAKRTVKQMVSDIRVYIAIPQKMDARFTRENYTKRSLQIVVDSGDRRPDVDRQVVGDPLILSDCFAQHVAYYRQDFFFELFRPLKAEQLPPTLENKLIGRMLLLGFNVKNIQSLPFKSSLHAFFEWILKV